MNMMEGSYIFMTTVIKCHI